MGTTNVNPKYFDETSLDRLLQEHAIYKQFYLDIISRPIGNPNFSTYWKAKAFDVNERVQRLSDNIPYFDPAWENANTVLFPLAVNNINL